MRSPDDTRLHNRIVVSKGVRAACLRPAILRVLACALVCAALVISIAGAVGAQESSPATAADPVGHLWIDMSLGQPLVGWYDEWARPSDIARVENIGEIGLLDDVSASRKLVVFKSAAAAEVQVPGIADKIDIIGYNLELGPQNPADEQADPIDGLRRMRSLADEYGLELAFGPDHSVALSHGAQAAPFVDYVILQVQRVQTNPDQVKEFVLPMAEAIRQANPDVQISVQVRTEGDVDAIVALLADLEPQLDGISILTSRETMETAVDLVSAIRPQEVIPGLPAASPIGEAPPLAISDSARTTLLRTGVVAGAVATLVVLGGAAIAIGAVLLWIVLLTRVQKRRTRERRTGP